MKQNKFNFITIMALFVIAFTSCSPTSHKNNNKNLHTQNLKALPLHFDKKIAKIINNRIVMIAKKHTLAEKWEALINSNTQLKIKFETINIETNDGNYYLVGTDNKIPAESKIKLVLDGGVLYEAKYLKEHSLPYGNQCTCSGCKATDSDSADKCGPKQNADGWYCSRCSQGTCTKTVSFQQGGIVN